MSESVRGASLAESNALKQIPIEYAAISGTDGGAIAPYMEVTS